HHLGDGESLLLRTDEATAQDLSTAGLKEPESLPLVPSCLGNAVLVGDQGGLAVLLPVCVVLNPPPLTAQEATSLSAPHLVLLAFGPLPPSRVSRPRRSASRRTVVHVMRSPAYSGLVASVFASASARDTASLGTRMTTCRSLAMALIWHSFGTH